LITECKESAIDRKQNIAIYGYPELPLIKGLIEKIAIFINPLDNEYEGK